MVARSSARIYHTMVALQLGYTMVANELGYTMIVNELGYTMVALQLGYTMLARIYCNTHFKVLFILYFRQLYRSV